MKGLRLLLAKENVAIEKTMVELKREFPLGTEVEFMIMHGQINPSTGTVAGHWRGGRLHVEHHQAKVFSRYSYRRVFFSDAVKI